MGQDKALLPIQASAAELVGDASTLSDPVYVNTLAGTLSLATGELPVHPNASAW